MNRTARRKHDLIDVIEATYNLTDALGEVAWLTDILEKFRPTFDGGMGVCVYLSEPGRPFDAVAAIGIPDGWDLAMRALMVSSAGSRLLHPVRPAITASDAIGRDVLGHNTAMRQEWHPRGVFDGVGMTANDGTGRLLTFVSPRPTVTSLSASVAMRYERVAAHIAAGWRLRRAIGSKPEAILTADGEVVHAEGRAREPSPRARLRDAARAIDRARGPRRRDGDEVTLEQWRVLVSGEWSLVDRFESDGRRYFVAHRNAPELTDPRALELRERAVLAYTALGHSLKLIGYELGMSPSRVLGLRARAMRKLGLRSLAEVATVFSSGSSGSSGS